MSLAVAPFMPSVAPRALAQLGHEYGYESDGNGGPPLLDELTWGAAADADGRLGAPEPLFPRLELESSVDAVDSGEA